MPPLSNLQRTALSLAVGQVLLSTIPVQAATVTVNSIADAPQGTPVSGCSLREAISLVNNPNQVSQDGCLAQGSGAVDAIDFALPSNSTILLSGDELSITETVSITGPGAEQLTIDAQNQSRIFNVYQSNSTNISGLTLSNGSSNSNGGAVYVDYSSGFSLSDSTISSSSSNGSGGGIYLADSQSASIVNSTISGNSADSSGGGILFESSDSGVISDVTISANSVTDGYGGGLYVYADNLRLESATITANSSTYGGGLNLSGESNTVLNSQINNNQARYGGGACVSFSANLSINRTSLNNNAAIEKGGGVYIFNAPDTAILNSTLANNEASNGGGIYLTDNDTSVIAVNSTLSANTATASGGGVYASSGILSLITNTINGNTASNSNAIYASTANNVVVDINNVIAGVGNDCNISLSNGSFNWFEDSSCALNASPNLSGDPQLGALQDNGGPTLTHLPLPNSGLIDSGDITACSNAPVSGLDQRGQARGTATCFIGAVEGVEEDSETFFVIPIGDDNAIVVPLTP